MKPPSICLGKRTGTPRYDIEMLFYFCDQCHSVPSRAMFIRLAHPTCGPGAPAGIRGGSGWLISLWFWARFRPGPGGPEVLLQCKRY